MSPESSDPSFITMWWTTLSVLRQTIMLPWLMDAGLGENDWAPLSPMIVIVVALAGGLPLPPVGPPPEPLQPAAASVAAMDAANSDERMRECLLAIRGE